MRFQRSALPKEGCNSTYADMREMLKSFNAQPSRRRAATSAPCRSSLGPKFQRSALPKEGCNVVVQIKFEDIKVSTLSPPEGGLQRRASSDPAFRRCFNAQPSRRRAATKCNQTLPTAPLFQRSALPKEGCNLVFGLHEPPKLFQRSALPKEGCNPVGGKRRL